MAVGLGNAGGWRARKISRKPAALKVSRTSLVSGIHRGGFGAIRERLLSPKGSLAENSAPRYSNSHNSSAGHENHLSDLTTRAPGIRARNLTSRRRPSNVFGTSKDSSRP